MSNYQDRKSFIERTKKIYEKSESENYDKTAFLNCCFGLLVAPQQWDKDDKHQIKENVDKEKWGVDESLIKVNEAKKGDALSVENIAYHFRNCLCHFLFDICGCNGSSFENIHLKDREMGNGKANFKDTFDMTMDFDDFKKFVEKYADEKLNLLKGV